MISKEDNYGRICRLFVYSDSERISIEGVEYGTKIVRDPDGIPGLSAHKRLLEIRFSDGSITLVENSDQLNNVLSAYQQRVIEQVDGAFQASLQRAKGI